MRWHAHRLGMLAVTVLGFAVAVPTFGCGSARTTPEVERPDAEMASGIEKRLCVPGDPSPKSSFTFQRFGNGLIVPGSPVMGDNGAMYLLIDKGCRFWVYHAGRSFGTARSGVLSDVQAEAYSASLRIADWSRWTGTYNRFIFDGPDDIYSYAGQQLFVTTAAAPRSFDEVEWLNDALLQLFNELEPSGTPWTGNVRWTLLQDEVSVTLPNVLEYRNAPAWPLEPEPSLVAIDPKDSTRPGHSHLSSASDAAKLRELRSQVLAGAVGVSYMEFLPVQQPNGDRYKLFLRDSIPLEDANGQMSFETTP